jgi:hypothetical protein
VVINKDPKRAGTATLKASKGGSYASNAAVSRLLVSGTADPLSARKGISLGGITYGDGIAQSGSRKVESLAVKAAAGGGLEVVLNMPPASAALVTLPRN